ncbi:hypothetical protein B0J13DRAFT_536416 [Dactylonectria estremocensis]|uniref:Uncharacterized protein n=1 Tax=Dactylonectria estremocensis TaxID=1079267 RepID=A0A9P9FIV7_9HYPO|nr:hypothetical protein B0J13DRAFT_536416 [Dactylonectria estremocensis]
MKHPPDFAPGLEPRLIVDKRRRIATVGCWAPLLQYEVRARLSSAPRRLSLQPNHQGWDTSTTLADNSSPGTLSPLVTPGHPPSSHPMFGDSGVWRHRWAGGPRRGGPLPPSTISACRQTPCALVQGAFIIIQQQPSEGRCWTHQVTSPLAGLLRPIIRANAKKLSSALGLWRASAAIFEDVVKSKVWGAKNPSLESRGSRGLGWFRPWLVQAVGS